jgi:hypothetical protein
MVGASPKGMTVTYYAPQPAPARRQRRIWPIVLFVILLVLVVLFSSSCSRRRDRGFCRLRCAHRNHRQDGRREFQEGAHCDLRGRVNRPIDHGVLQHVHRQRHIHSHSVKSGWSQQVEIAGFAGPNMTDSLDPTLTTRQKAGTVTCRILAGGKMVTENKATGEYAIATCSASMQDVDRVAGTGG